MGEGGVRRAGRAGPDSPARPRLAARDAFLVEVGDRVLIQAMKVEPGAKAQESAADADRRALEKHEFARHRQASTLSLQGAHHLANLAPPIFWRRVAGGGRAHAIVAAGGAQ